MSRRGDDTAAGGEDEFSVEDEFRDWAEEAAAEPAEGGQGWMGRIFGRKAQDDVVATDEDVVATDEDAVAGDEAEPPEDSPAPADLEDPEPDQLGVFSAIDPSAVPPIEAAPEEMSATPDESEVGTEAELFPVTDDDDREDSDPTAADASETAVEQDVGEPPQVAAPGAGASGPSFADLWGSQSDEASEEVGEDIVDFAEFTSEDYLAATTREYAGLAEAVARAEEQGTQQMAVSAEIPGLESGLVGLEDVVDAETGTPSADVIAPPATSELSVRVLTALGLIVLFAASLLSPYGIGALIFVVLFIAAGELFAALIRAQYRPLSIFGFLGVGGAFAGTWAAGPVAIPIALLATGIAVLLFYATVPGRRAALENASLTIMVTAWIGGLGAFAFDFLESDDYMWLVLGLVVTVAAMDVGQYFFGRRLGRRQLAPIVSPKKTVEGYVAGVFVAIGVGAAFAWAPPFEMTDGLVIGAVVAIVSPLGDLSVSVVKRALGVKDMGYILPGHGGVLDRVDAMIITIPALWIAYSWMGLLT